jgi:hypothetical protein
MLRSTGLGQMEMVSTSCLDTGSPHRRPVIDRRAAVPRTIRRPVCGRYVRKSAQIDFRIPVAAPEVLLGALFAVGKEPDFTSYGKIS